MAGLLVVLEGQDYCGKTTTRENVAQLLRDKGYDVVVTREPGGTPIAEKLRDFIFANRDENSRLAELYLFQAARADHVEKVIRPAIQAGKIVLCDRFFLSTWAWQVYPYLTEQDTSLLQAFGESLQVVLGDLGDIYQLYLDVPKSVRQERMAQVGARNSFDNMPPEIAAKIEEAYELLRTSDDVNYINANEAPDVVAQVALGMIENAIINNDQKALARSIAEENGAEEVATPAEAEAEVADADLPPLETFIEESIVQSFTKFGLPGLLHQKTLNKWKVLCKRKGNEIYKVALNDKMTGHQAYQQVDRAITLLAQMAHAHEAAEQMLNAKAPSKVQKQTTKPEAPTQTKPE